VTASIGRPRRNRARQGVAVTAALALLLTACGGGGDDEDDEAGGGEPQAGGTLTFLTLQEQINHLDPQRNYAGEDLAFASGYLHRSLNVYAYSADEEEATQLVADLATDTGTPNEDATAWSWTLRDGVAWEDGSPVTCEDVKYGVSRTFATDVITDGPQYAVSMLDIPSAEDGSSVYKGPYVTDGNDTAAFDEAVVCDGNTITFNLSKPVPDFNYTVTLLAFAPVPEAADTGEDYDDKPMSNGPYKVQEYTIGEQLVLERNENWDPETDDYRPAYPDRIVVRFGLDPFQIDQRLVSDAGADQQALTEGDPLQTATLSQVFNSDRFADRRTNELDPFVQYIAINTAKVPNLKHRQAIAAAMDRGLIRRIAGGEYAGPLADGVIKPNLPTDYEESGMWEGLLGAPIPDNGDPDYARTLIEESGEPMPRITYDYNRTPVNDDIAAAIIDSLGAAGIQVRPNPLEPGQYYSIVLDPAKQGHMSAAGWGPDWANASTVIPELFTPSGGFNLSQADDEEFNELVEQARVETDREAQAALWKDLNKRAMENVWVVPTRFNRDQRLAGSKVKTESNGNPYLWAPFGSWPYGELYVEQ
jgi:peptide/nickel transport system substrate-binding protein